MKEQSKKKVILMIVGVIALMLVVVGATYAYFSAQIGKGDSAQINAQAGTTDSLSFNISDIDVSDDANKILDENADDANIIINANQTNFGPNGNSLGDGVKLNAHLIAGNDDNDAHYEYYVYLNISANNLEYTTPESTPELVLVVQKPDGKYLDEIEGLEKDEITLGEESVPCFDITKASGLITIASKYKIDATEETQGEADQNWQVKVIFKNLETDQHLNTNKTFQANLSIQSEKLNYLDLASYAECNEGYSCTYTDYRSADYNSQIKNVYFVNKIAEEGELNSIAKWDLSSSKDGSIIGWLQANQDQDVPYDLYIGSNLKDDEKIKVKSFAHAFQGLSNVETIDLKPIILDTSNLNDTNSMFSGTSKLITITGIENLDVSNVIDMSNMFSESSMSSLDLSNWNTHNVTNMSHIFEGMTSLTEIIGIEDLDVSNVIDMSYMFAPLSLGDGVAYDGLSLTKLDLSSWNVENVRDMSNMFSVVNLTELNINGWNTHNVTNMSDMFSGKNGEFDDYYSNIDNIIGIEDLDTSSVTNMSRMFSHFKGINSLDLSNWDMHNVTDMSGMFANVRDLTTLNINNWNTHNVMDMSSMFGSFKIYEYTSITNIDGLEKLDVSNVTDMSHMFCGANNLTKLDLRKWDTKNVTDMSSMFSQTSKLTTIEGIETLNTSQVTDMSYMFFYASSLAELDLSNWDTSNTTDMFYMFGGIKITELDLSKWNTHNVTDMSEMFFDASNLKTLKVNDWDLSGTKLYNRYSYGPLSEMFSGTSKLTTIEGIETWNVTEVTDMSRMFLGANNLTKLDLSGWDTSNVTNMSEMFLNTGSLTSLDMRKATFTQVSSYSNMLLSFHGKITITGAENKQWLLDNTDLTENNLIVLSE